MSPYQILAGSYQNVCRNHKWPRTQQTGGSACISPAWRWWTRSIRKKKKNEIKDTRHGAHETGHGDCGHVHTHSQAHAREDWAEPHGYSWLFYQFGEGGFWNISTNLAVCLRCLLGISTAGSLLYGHRYEGKREVDYSWYNASLSTANLPTNGSETHCDSTNFGNAIHQVISTISYFYKHCMPWHLVIKRD